ncbi:MAG: M24 family peptidase [Thaumarchaeota archaeon]|nr:M24 family peptidase [Nitrososphaerota archaeon]
MSNEELFPKFSDSENSRRSNQVKSMMRSEEVDALLIHGNALSPGGVNYLSNYVPRTPVWLFYPLEGEPILMLHFHNHIPNARAMSIVDDIRWYGPNPSKIVAEIIKERGLSRSGVGIVGLSNSIPYGQFIGLKQLLPETNLKDVAKHYTQIRVIRSQEELGWIKKSAHLTDLTVEALEDRIKPGLSGYDLSNIVHSAFLPHGGLMGIHFISSTSMTNPDRQVPWQFMTPRVLERGDAVTTEVTIYYWAYGTQIHRPFAVGREPTPLYKKLFDVALEAYERVAKVIRPGATSKDVLNASSIIEERGFTVYDSLVHGEGGKSPELGTRTSAHTVEPYEFKENMVVVIQPNPVTLDGKAGLQLGAANLVTNNGAISLHEYPFKFPVCG